MHCFSKSTSLQSTTSRLCDWTLTLTAVPLPTGDYPHPPKQGGAGHTLGYPDLFRVGGGPISTGSQILLKLGPSPMSGRQQILGHPPTWAARFFPMGGQFGDRALAVVSISKCGGGLFLLGGSPSDFSRVGGVMGGGSWVVGFSWISGFLHISSFFPGTPKISTPGGGGWGGGFLAGRGYQVCPRDARNLHKSPLSPCTYPPKRGTPICVEKPPRWGGTIRYTEPTFLVFFVVLHIFVVSRIPSICVVVGLLVFFHIRS